MGIKDLFKVINRICPDQVLEFSLSEWGSCSFAIDVSIFLYKTIKTMGDDWAKYFMKMLISLKKNNIKAVCIFDGPNPPEEKKQEQFERRAAAEKAVSRMDECRKLKRLIEEKYLYNDEFLPENIQEKAKSLIGTQFKNLSKIMYSQPLEVYNQLEAVRSKLEKQTAPITDKHRSDAWKIVELLGMSAYQADGEAETLCASMAIHGLVDAVLTEDTDVMAYGAPWFLAYRSFKIPDEKICGIYMPNLLEAMGYTMDEFRDLCIMLGCDYNSRVKGYPPDGKKYKKPTPLGEAKVTCMIDEYRTIEAMEPYIEDIEPLKYERCRFLFTPYPKEEIDFIIPLNTKPNFDDIEKFLIENGINYSTSEFRKYWDAKRIIIEDSCSEDSDD